MRFSSNPFLIICLFFSCSAILKAQCSADAGADQHWCRTVSTNVDTLNLGGNPTAFGGIPPYQYEWSIKPIQLSSTLTFFASHFLNDTTVANPVLMNSYGYSLMFRLKVKDSNGQLCMDSTEITSTRFAQSLVTYTFNIWKGDSVQLMPPDVGIVGTQPNLDSILWRPNMGLIDSTVLQPWVKPDSDVVYYCTIWDSKGCMQEGSPFQYVYVHQIGLEENKMNLKVDVFPTIIGSARILSVKISDFAKNYAVHIYNSQGQKLRTETLSGTEVSLNLNNLKSGVYLCSVYSRNQLLVTKKFLVK